MIELKAGCLLRIASAAYIQHPNDNKNCSESIFEAKINSESTTLISTKMLECGQGVMQEAINALAIN